jgi:hypothetical protein
MQDRAKANTAPAGLFEQAQPLTEEQAGGHGDRWAVFTADGELDPFFGEWLAVAMERSKVVELGVTDPAGQDRVTAAGELAGMGLLYADRHQDQDRAGLLALIAMGVED